MAETVTIIDLIRNGTMTSGMAATMWAAMDRGLSMVVVAIPRFAGKTTTSNAILSLLPPETPVHQLSGEEAEMDELKEAATGGYLAVAEFSQGPVPRYIWGAPVRRVFDTMTAGYSLSSGPARARVGGDPGRHLPGQRGYRRGGLPHRPRAVHSQVRRRPGQLLETTGRGA